MTLRDGERDRVGRDFARCCVTSSGCRLWLRRVGVWVRVAAWRGCWCSCRRWTVPPPFDGGDLGRVSVGPVCVL
jgi:hypothetical protein